MSESRDQRIERRARIIHRYSTAMDMRDAARAIEASDAEAGVMEWRPIEDAPRDGTELLLSDPTGSYEVGSWYDGRWFSQLPMWCGEGVAILWDPTNFMTLPPPPPAKKP